MERDTPQSQGLFRNSHYTFVSVNLETQPIQEVAFPLSDYGFLYGYGLFETVPVIEGQPVFLKQHIARLKRGSLILDIPFEIHIELIEHAIRDLILKNNALNATLNIYLTGGDREGPIGEVTEPMFMMVLRKPIKTDPSKAIKLALREESFKRTPLDRMKTMSWIKNVLERRFVTDADDVLLYSQENGVLETSAANVFFVRGNQLLSPNSSVILPGIAREMVLNNHKEWGFSLVQDYISLDQLHTFDEIFLTNSVKGIILVKELEQFSGLKSRHVSEQIQAAYFDLQRTHVKV